ncbi:MAG: rep family protein, partial [Planctomycetota bacterium]
MRRVYNALKDTHQSVSRILGFADCGARAYVYRTLDDPPHYRVAGSACHDRFCMPCTRERGLAIASNIHAHLDGQRARFVTLTLRTEGLSLRDVTGGAAFVEVKWNPQSARWHPHVHAIVQGRYIPHDLLRRAWLLITGDSSVVRVQVVKSHESVTRYVTTYASKTVRTSDFPTDASLREAITALHGTRLCRTFGTWRGVALTKTEPDGVWIIVDSLQAILFAALHG